MKGAIGGWTRALPALIAAALMAPFRAWNGKFPERSAPRGRRGCGSGRVNNRPGSDPLLCTAARKATWNGSAPDAGGKPW